MDYEMFEKIYPTNKGLRKVLFEYQELAIRKVWEQGEDGINSGQVWREVHERLRGGESISRASIINFLNEMVDHGVLGYRIGTGKGGKRRIYFPLMTEGEYVKTMIKTTLESFMSDFPETTKEVIQGT